MRQYNLSILKPPTINTNQTGTTNNSTNNLPMSSHKAPAKSLELLRQNVQRSLNSELKTVISKYLEVFFKPGIENIRSNSGPDSVTEEHIHTMCRQILEEAKKMYPVHPSTPSLLPNNTASSSDLNNEPSIDFHNTAGFMQHQIPNTDGIKAPLTSPSFGAIKRESDSDSETSSLSNASKKIKKSKTGPAKNTGNSNVNSSNNSNASTNSSASPNKPKKPSGPSRKHVANWDADKFTLDTLFIMGAKANKALGFAQTRGRLYVKHPGLFKYASDSDDKEWLSKNKLMPATGGRAYIMLLEDIEKLARDNKLKAEINYDDIKGFRVPEFILDKMKAYINTWKKQYAEDAQRNTSANRNRNVQTMNVSQNSSLMSPSTTNSNSSSINLGPLNPPSLPPIHVPPMQQQQQPPPQPQLPQMPNSHNQQQQNMNSYHMNRNSPANVMYEPSLLTLSSVPQSHDIGDMGNYQNPPMYPGHTAQQQQQHTLPPMSSTSTGYVHSTHIDPIEQALSKGDWSGVSDRSLLQYALQGSRNLGLWDPQDSFDLIESATNGNSLSGGPLGDEGSPLLQISPDTGAHLAAPPLLPVSPNCELSAVMDQAFQYTDT